MLFLSVVTHKSPHSNSYGKTGVFGRPVTFVFSAVFQRPNFFNTSTRSNRFNTLRFLVPLFAFPKLGCLDMIKKPLLYLIFGMNAFNAGVPSRAFAWFLKPDGKLSLQGPVFFDGAWQRRRDWLRLSACLAIRTI